jgi:hypothetical protein
MRFASLLLALTSLLPTLRAQGPLAPPAQTHVAALGASPLRAPATADFTPGASLTLEGWFYLTAHTPYAWLMGKGLATSGTDPFVSFALQLAGDGTKLAFVTSTGTAGSYRELVAPAAVPLRTWTHIAAVLENGATTRLLVNGTIVASGAAAGAPLAAPSVPFGVGSAYLANGGTNYPGFPGFARHVRFWSTARAAAQISADASVALPSARTGLIAAWPLDDTSGATARDLSGANRALTAPTGSLAPTRLAVLEAGPFFSIRTVNVDPTLGRSFDQAIAFDFDGDGDSDVVGLQLVPAVFPANPSRLVALRNTGGILVEATNAVLGDVRMEWPARVFAFDANRDGRADLFIAGFGTDTAPFPGEQPRLLIQTADGRLFDETAARLPQQKCAAHGAAIGDIDGDGDIDIYMSNLDGGTVGPRFYINDGRGNFSESDNRIPSDIANRQQRYTAAALVDVNGNGFPDLVLGGFAGAPDELLINDGSGRFVRNPRFTMPARTGREESGTLDIGVADFDGNGAPDLLLGCTGGKRVLDNGINAPSDGYRYATLRLLLNRGDGTFFDASDRLQFKLEEDSAWIQTVVIGDFNNDGRPDAAILGRRFDYSAMQQLLLLNRGGGQLVNASEGLVGPALAATPTFIAPADFDRDGSMDFFTQTNGQFYQVQGLKTLPRALFQTTPDDVGRLANLSVRTQAGTGDQTLITGFALGGAGTKPLLVRAVGPTLSAFGLTGTLPDPFVEIAPLNAAKVTENNNWSGTAALKNAFASVGAFGLATDTSLDAALVFSPSAGAYTAKITDTAARPGLALVEIYDTGTTNTPKLINLSARTQVGTGADALIVGFVVSGNVPKKFLIRAVGPTLGAFGVGGTLADPLLDVRPLGSENIVATNDDWRGTPALKAAFTSVGAFALATDTSRDAALAIELPPGAYTATVSGKQNTTGVALVEVYELP